MTQSCAQFRSEDEDLLKEMDSQTYPVEINRYRAGDYTIRYVETGNKNGYPLLFLHGAPGDLGAFNPYLADPELGKYALMISPDRPGYGESGLGKSLTSLREQSRLLKPLLEKLAAYGPVTIAGHSYGATIAARMAMDYPNLVDSLYLISGAVDPENERIYWFNKPLDSKALRWILPKALRVSNDEKVTHVAELEQMISLWPKVTARTVIIHGDKDSLVSVKNAYFAEEKLVNAETELFVVSGENHFILWTAKELITGLLKEHFKSLDTGKSGVRD